MDDKVSKLAKLYAILMQLRSTSGSNAKKAILEAHKDNAELKLFLYHTYEPTISYYQTKVLVVPTSMGWGDDPTFDLTYDKLDELIETLAERVKTGHDASYYLGDFYNNLRENWMRDLITILIGRDIKAGVKYKTINKVWPGLITHVPYMRCTLPKNVNLMGWPWAEGVDSEIKYDGMYANIRIYLKDIIKSVVESRKGSLFLNAPFTIIIDSLSEIADSLVANNIDFADEDYIVFNGELEMLDKDGKLLPRADGNGKFNSLLQSGVIPNGFTPQYKVWDFVPGSKFEQGKFDMQRKRRKAALALSFVSEVRNVELGKTVVCYSYDEAVTHFKALRALGLEGSIIKHPEGIWEDGTSSYQVKLKAEVEIDLKLISFNAGSGRNEDTFGSIRFETECGRLVVDVNGRTDEMREFFHANRDTLPGSIHTVLSNELMVPKKVGDKYSLFLPRYQIARPDKDTADTLQRVIDIFASVMKDEEENE